MKTKNLKIYIIFKEAVSYDWGKNNITLTVSNIVELATTNDSEKLGVSLS
jgi:hypothetical protein